MLQAIHLAQDESNIFKPIPEIVSLHHPEGKKAGKKKKGRLEKYVYRQDLREE